MEDLVGVGVADAAEEMRVGQGPLERVVLATEHRSELLERRREHLEPAGVQRLQGVLAAEQEQRRPPLRAGLGEQQACPSEKSKAASAFFARELDARRLPVQSAGDHQVQHQPQVVVEPQRDAFADAPELADDLAARRIERRLERPQQERAVDRRRLRDAGRRCAVSSASM